MSLGPHKIYGPLDPKRTDLPSVHWCGCTLCYASQQGENERARREGRAPRNVTEIREPTQEPTSRERQAARKASR